MKLSAARWFASLAGFVVLITSVMPVDAAYYRGRWDPAFGEPFTGLGWRGEATFFAVPGSGCDAGFICAAAPGSFVETALVEFYDLSNPSVNVGRIVWSAPELGADFAITQLRFDESGLTQIGTIVPRLGFRQPTLVAPTVATDFVNFGTAAFSLGFLIGSESYSGPFLSYRFNSTGTIQTNDFNQFPALDFTITPVPEPSTLALAAVGLLGIAFATRRRRAENAAGTPPMAPALSAA